jgi:hypothetical protein
VGRDWANSEPGLRFRKWFNIFVFAVGIVYLGTAGVQFVFEGNPRGGPGFVGGIAAIAVGIHQSIRVRRARQALELQAAANRPKGARRRSKRKAR